MAMARPTWLWQARPPTPFLYSWVTAQGGFVLAGDFLVGLAPNALALGDLNGDGRLDIVVTNSGANNISVLLSQSP